MVRRLIPVFFLLSAVALAQYSSSSQAGVKLRGGRSISELYAGQKTVLSNYCRLDFEGARLQPGGWVRFRPYTNLPSNPEFTRVVIVTRFDMEQPDQPSEILYVNYQSVGYFQEGEGFTESRDSDRVAFRLQEKSDELLLTKVEPADPHVSVRAVLQWMTQRLSDPKTSDIERSHLQDAIRQLSKLAPGYSKQTASATAP